MDDRMGAGRKSQTFIINGNAPSSPSAETNNLSARNLRKSQLGGVIFGCKNTTIKECLFTQLFGLPRQHFSYVKNIDPGLPLFLFNYSDRKLHGIFEAASSGELNINPYGWTTNGSERTSYPAQVQIRVRLHCQPLLEEQFRPIIADNYYTRNHFWFELDHAQTNKLMSLLAPLAVAASAPIPQSTKKWRYIVQGLPSSDTKEEVEGFETPALEVKQSGSSSRKLDFTDVFPYVDGAKEKYEKFRSPSEVEHSNLSSRKSDSTDFAHFDGEDHPLETHLDAKLVEQKEKDLILKKLKELALKRENDDLHSTNHVEGSSIINDMHLEDRDFRGEHDETFILQLINGMEELKEITAEQTRKIGYLEQKLVEAEKEIQRLKNHCTVLESMSNSSLEPFHERVIESFDEPHLDPAESIFLVGGYDGESWLSALDSYFPSHDVIKSYRPMSSVRSYASIARMNGELFVFGGGNGYLWYDTVESYSPHNDQWTCYPSLNGKKGSLAGATLNNKIFAIGGGNGVESFSDVEMLDLDVGRWIHTRSMLQKRFSLAAAELNGVLYAIGGYDGNAYLNSAERFDPREHSWTRIANMKSKRGCHAVAVLNEKIYALGGFDGDAMVSSVEIFDPRLGSWIRGDPLNQSRGYSVAAVVNESIYVIGGVRSGQDIIDTVEWSKEGQGWQGSTAKAIGKRCFLSAITSL